VPFVVLATPPPATVAPSVVVEVAQRRVAPLPGFGGRWRLRLGDVSRGHVRVVVEPAPGHAGPAALDVVVADGGRYAFVAEGQPYLLEVEALINYLVGSDFARLRVIPLGEGRGPQAEAPSGPTPPVIDVDALLTDLASAPVVFLRNGVAHDPAEAVAHLRAKWSAEGGPETTSAPEAFIERFGTRSSTSDAPYEVRHPDGRTEPAAAYLRARLEVLRRQASSRRTPSSSSGKSGP
jgi:hypothetical protein